MTAYVTGNKLTIVGSRADVVRAHVRCTRRGSVTLLPPGRVIPDDSWACIVEFSSNRHAIGAMITLTMP